MPVFARFLPYFLSVARHGSIRRASEELRIAASAIDRQIQLAEEAFRVALFERTPSGMRLTAAGELLLHQARGWTGDLATLVTQFDDMRGLRRGTVRLAVIDALAKGALVDLTARLLAVHPRLTMSLTVLDNKDVAACVVSGDAELGLMLGPRPSRDLTIQPLRDYPLGFVLPPGHPLAGHETLPASAGAEERVIAPAAPLALHEQMAAIEAVAGFAFNRVASADSIQMIKSLIRAGAGIGILCALDVADEVTRGELSFVPIRTRGIPPLTLALCTSRTRQIAGPARLLMSQIEEGFGTEP
ncbi:LysR family transcriptional regulator [Acetobacteraceae bacterium KSS8]|uniref:LysR family transcriptional regulator n=1 Tax=Endosaccharibacter trunci TaxID=2812733 RepID=A0ABT1W9N5_9PROT|nr:LysR family transcriptional regulator [Acetobacteraceae bacterium KSS8]